jgi:hypothetical protein
MDAKTSNTRQMSVQNLKPITKKICPQKAEIQ